MYRRTALRLAALLRHMPVLPVGAGIALTAGNLAWPAAAAACDTDAHVSKGSLPPSPYATLADMVEATLPSVAKVVGSVGGRSLGGGSGFVISENGLLVTNDHVCAALSGAGGGVYPLELTAVFDDGRAYRLEYVASDPESDIAVCRIVGAPDGTRFRPIAVGRSSSLRRGDTVAVLGAPFGGSVVPTVGVLSGQRFVADDEAMLAVLHSRLGELRGKAAWRGVACCRVVLCRVYCGDGGGESWGGATS